MFNYANPQFKFVLVILELLLIIKVIIRDQIL